MNTAETSTASASASASASAQAQTQSRSIQLEIHVPANVCANGASTTEAAAAASAVGFDKNSNLAALEAKEELERAQAVYRHAYYVTGIVSVVIGALFFVFEAIAMRFSNEQLETAAGLWSGCAFGIINGSLALRAAASKRFSFGWVRVTFGFAIASTCMHVGLAALSVFDIVTTTLYQKYQQVYYDDYFTYRRFTSVMVIWSPLFGITAGAVLVGIDIYYLVHATRLRRQMISNGGQESEDSNAIVTYLPNVECGGGAIQVTVKINPVVNPIAQDRLQLIRRIAVAKHSMVFVGICSVILGCWLLVLEVASILVGPNQFWIGLWAGLLPGLINAAASFQHYRELRSATSGRRVKLALAIASITLVLYVTNLIVRVVGVASFSFDSRKRLQYYYYIRSMNTNTQMAFEVLLMNIPVVFAAISLNFYQISSLEALRREAVGRKSNLRQCDAEPDTSASGSSNGHQQQQSDQPQNQQRNVSDDGSELLHEGRSKYRILSKNTDLEPDQPTSENLAVA